MDQLINKFIKLSQKTNNIKYGIIITYLILIIPVCVSLILPHAGLLTNWVFRLLNLAGLIAFWLYAVVLGRLSGVTQGFAGYLVILSVLVEENFSFLLGSQIFLIMLFVLGTFWLIYDLLRAFLYASTIARLDPRTLSLNINGSFGFAFISYCLSYGPSASLVYLSGSGKSAQAFFLLIYHFLQVLGPIAMVLSLGFYLANWRQRVNRTTILGNSFLLIASFIYTFLYDGFVNLVFSSFFFYVIALMILGCVLVIPVNINKDSLKNHDLATSK